MPSYCIHITHGLEILEKFKIYISSKKFGRKKYLEAKEAIINGQNNEWKKQFMTGLILPDAAKKSGCGNYNQLDRNAHYPKNQNGYFKTPDMEKFLKEYPLSLDNPLCLGYAIHLYLDSVYDEFLQGICHFNFDASENIQNINCKVKDNTNGQIETKDLSEDGFWDKLYDDYTRLNPYYMQKKNFNIDNFVSADDFSPMIPAQFVWYKELYICMQNDILKKAKDVISNNEVESKKEQLELLDVFSIDKLIDKAAEDFVNLYLKPLISNKKFKKSKNKETENNWNAESIKLEYYKIKWNELVNIGAVKPADELFFEGVIEEILDVANHATIHKNKHKKVSDVICGVPLLITVFSGAATFLSDDIEKFGEEERSFMFLFIFIFSFLSTTFSAFLSIMNSYNEKMAYKETWLRQRLYYSMLMLETEEFCEKLNKYRNKSDSETVEIYMKSIGRLRKKDYENFFVNMGCSNYEKN